MNRRFVVYWVLFLVFTAALAGLSGWFVFKESQRFDESVTLALKTQLDAASETVNLLTEEIKDEAARQLVSFHMEGLNYRLERWVNENDVVAVSFVKLVDGELYQWGDVGEMQFAGVLDGPNIRLVEEESLLARLSSAETDYGYLAENVEMYEYGGGIVAPKIRWYVWSHDGESNWVCVHEIVAGEAVRGFVLNNGFLLTGYGEVIKQHETGEVGLSIEEGLAMDLPEEWMLVGDLGELFQGYGIVAAARSSVFEQAKLQKLFAVLVVVLFLALSIGGTLLILNAYRSYQEVMQKATFVTSVSHELKTPLTSIRMFADLLSGDDVGVEKRAQYAGTITRESQRLTSMINNLLTYSGLEHGKKQYRQRKFELVAVIAETIRDYTRTVELAGMELESVLPEAEIAVTFDPSVIKQVVINLIENALKHARDGRFLQIEVRTGAGVAEVVVSDRGAGVASGLKEKIFEPFVQGQDDLTNKKSGAGLGLSIARTMMRDCGGELRLAKSKSGAAFVMRIKYTD